MIVFNKIIYIINKYRYIFIDNINQIVYYDIII